MRSDTHGKVDENWGPLSPEANPTLPGWQTRKDPAIHFGAILDHFSRRLSSWDLSDRDGALSNAIEVLARGLKADRVSFFIATGDPNQSPSDSFGSLASWKRADTRFENAHYRGSVETSVATPMHLDSLPEQGARLRSGLPLQIGPGIHSSLSATSIRAKTMTSWAQLRTKLYLPCVCPEGLRGFFVVESATRVGNWSVPALQQASLVGALFAGFLEREAMAAELDRLRVQRSQGEQLETLGLVASSVAHDFNNVLTAILGYADLAGMEIAENGPGQLEISEIRTAAMRAAELVEQVLAPSRRLGAGAQSVDLCEVVGNLEGMLGRIVGEAVDVELRLSDRVGRIFVDPARLERALFNLASNSRDALASTPGAEGRFELSTVGVEIDAEDQNLTNLVVANLEPGRYVRLSVRDNGCGIPGEIQAEIFEPFFTTRRKGTGLGLAAVAEFMEEAHGAIQVESTIGEGTCLHLYFPAETIPHSEII